MLYVLAIVGVLVTGDAAGPDSFDAYRTKGECEAVLNATLLSKQKQADEEVGPGIIKIYGSCVAVKPAGTRI